MHNVIAKSVPYKLEVLCRIHVQGDQAACPKPPIDIDVKVKDLILQRNDKSISTGGLGRAAWSPCNY